ncbi:MAG: tRNA 4-thiouridine(8) synthase ThiI, partial [Thermus sp.]
MGVFLIRYGEIALKGKNRAHFEKALEARLRQALAPWGGRVRRGVGRFFAEAPDLLEVHRALSRVFGVVSYSPALKVPLEMAAIEEATLRLAQEEVARGER